MNLSYLLESARWSGAGGIADRLGEHLAYTGVAVLAAALLAIPAGLLIGHTGRGRWLARALTGAGRAVPALGLVVLVVVLLGPGLVPVLVVLTVLAIPPILLATVVGVTGADQDAVHAGRALGLTPGQLVARVEWPQALPHVITGLRNAALQVIAATTIAAYAASGGLGRLVFDGIVGRNSSQVVAGALLVAGLAIAAYAVLGLLARLAARRTRQTRRTAVSLVAIG